MKRMRMAARATALVMVLMAGSVKLLESNSGSGRADLIQSSGKITFLRVHDVGSSFGPPSDAIDVEVVIQLNTKPGESYGFQLRNDANRAARQGMLDLLRNAFDNNWTVVIDYNITPPKKNGVIIRVAVVK